MKSLTSTHQDQAIPELLAMTIFADKKICSEEIKAFSVSVQDLQERKVLISNFTETKIILWYEMYKLPLQEKLKTHNFEFWLAQTLETVNKSAHKPAILDAIDYIARADDEHHISEKAYKVLAAAE